MCVVVCVRDLDVSVGRVVYGSNQFSARSSDPAVPLECSCLEAAPFES